MIGETLDEKYKIEKELGRGGMGTVYLATHLGTDRPVAVKIISPEFMRRAEFVERFRREARAAGRLRHPNVVDVTDFGFARTKQGDVAYLVMEYLDGCSLAEVLEEEAKLSLSWTLDIIEQVCSAVHQAHQQGIIHRDLKPENIWLEPNQRGGYTVKVLDFGIAKLEAPKSETDDETSNKEKTELSSSFDIPFSEKETLVISDSESPTALLSVRETQKSISQPTGSSKDLTRVGTILGTPVYMSPEQCRGEKLDARSDVYSIGVIAYRMLSGRVPFEGEYNTVMESHIKKQPPPLIADNVPRKAKQIIYQALSKNPDERPQTAQAFAAKLRAASEGIGHLLQKSMVIYSEYLPKFLLMGFLAVLPVALINIVELGFYLLDSFYVIAEPAEFVVANVSFLFSFLTQSFTTAFLIGCSTWLVGQRLALPLRPMQISGVLGLLIPKMKRLLFSVIILTIVSFLGFLFCIIPGIWFGVRYFLVPPVVVIENVGIKQAFSRSAELVRRSYKTALALVTFSYIVPLFLSLVLIFFAETFTKAYLPDFEALFREQRSNLSQVFSDNEIRIEVGSNAGRRNDIEKKEIKRTAVSAISEMFWIPFSVFFLPFFSIATALFYFKTRLAGGESLQDLLRQFEEKELPKTKWQQKMKLRFISSGR